jgi:transcriptional regulator with XRE-family HTH domain
LELLASLRLCTLKKLAAETKLNVSQISAIERGTNLPSIESFLAICRAFEKEPSEVLGSIDF